MQPQNGVVRGGVRQSRTEDVFDTATANEIVVPIALPQERAGQGFGQPRPGAGRKVFQNGRVRVETRVVADVFRLEFGARPVEARPVDLFAFLVEDYLTRPPA